MSVGDGQTGLLSNLRTYAEFVGHSSVRRQQLLDVSPGFELTPSAWVLDGTDIYRQRCHIVFNHRLLNLVSVESMVEPRQLKRVYTLNELVPAGTWFFDYSAAVPAQGKWWNDGLTKWNDPGPTWNAYGNYVEGVLYVHLPDDSHPAATTVIAPVGFRFAGIGQVLPVLATNQLTDPSIDLWTTSNDPTSWAQTADVSQANALIGSGYAARVSGSVPAGTLRSISQGGLTFVKGEHYFYSGAYRTGVTNPAEIEPRIRVLSGGTVHLRSDGRETETAAIGFPLANTFGEVRYFCFVFRCPILTLSGEVLAGLYNTGHAAIGEVTYDRMRLQKVESYEYYEPRLSAESLPETETASIGIAWGEKTIGLGQVSILNHDGMLDIPLGALTWDNKPCIVQVGGSFADGQALTRDEYRTQFAAIVNKTTWNRSGPVHLDLLDTWGFLMTPCPPRKYSVAENATMDPDYDGKVRAMGWGIFGSYGGALELIKPVMLSKSSTTLYGTYEVWDPVPSVNGMRANIDVFAYPTQEDAAQASARGYQLTLGTHYTQDVAACTFAMIEDGRNYQFDDGGTDVGTRAVFDFNLGAEAFQADLNIAGPASLVASDLQARMRAVSGDGDLTVTYSNTTHKFTVTNPAQTLNLLTKTGINSHLNSWAILGFDRNIDHTGASSYTGENATFSDPRRQHILRVQCYGYQDDAAGTITGVANQQLFSTRNVVYNVLLKVAKIPAARLDVLSLKRANGIGSYPLGPIGANNWMNTALWREGTVGSVIAAMERSDFADVVIDADGNISYRPFVDAQVVASFFDRDYLSMELTRASDSTYRKVRLLYAPNPNQDLFRVREFTVAESAGVPIRTGRDNVVEIQTFHRRPVGNEVDSDTGISVAGPWYARLYALNPLIAVFSAGTKLADVTIGDKVELTVDRAPTPTGRLDAVKFRVRGLKHNGATGVSTCTAVEDVLFNV